MRRTDSVAHLCSPPPDPRRRARAAKGPFGARVGGAARPSLSDRRLRTTPRGRGATPARALTASEQPWRTPPRGKRAPGATPRPTPADVLRLVKNTQRAGGYFTDPLKCSGGTPSHERRLGLPWRGERGPQ